MSLTDLSKTVEEYLQKDKKEKELKEKMRKQRIKEKRVKKDYLEIISTSIKELGKKLDDKFYHVTFDEYIKPLKCVRVKDFGYVHEKSVVLKEVMLFYNEENGLLHLIYKHLNRSQLCLNKYATYCELLSVITHLEEYKFKKPFNNPVVKTLQSE